MHFFSTDYVVSEDNTAYAKMHKKHLARTQNFQQHCG